MATGAYYWIVSNAESLPTIMGGHAAWRYTLMSGLAPAIPLIVIRPLPSRVAEVGAAQARRHAETAKLRRAVRTAVPAHDDRHDGDDGAVYGAAFGAIQQMPRIVPGLEEVRALARTAQEQTISVVQTYQESAAWRDASRWQSSPPSSSAAAG